MHQGRVALSSSSSEGHWGGHIMFNCKTIALAAVFLISFASRANAGLAYEFECSAVQSQEESSVLRVSISPSGADLMDLRFQGEIDEAYSRDEVSQFKFDILSRKKTELYLFVNAAEEKSGPQAFRVFAKRLKGKGDLIGRIEFLDLIDLSYRIAHSSKIRCKQLQ